MTSAMIERAAAALARAVDERGAPNRFYFGELYESYGAPATKFLRRIGQSHLAQLNQLLNQQLLLRAASPYCVEYQAGLWHTQTKKSSFSVTSSDARRSEGQQP